MYKFLQLFILFIFIFITITYSQERPIEWGEVSVDDLKMTSFPQDSNASGVILCDYGESKINDELGIDFNRFLRIKILNENGYKLGTHSIYIYSDKYGDVLSKLEASTFSLDKNGEIIENELEDDQVFEEKTDDDHIKYKFTMPALSPGCIIDIHYKITAESIWFIRSWVFQTDEPVLWSEYRLTYPKNISYAIVSSGLEPWALNEYDEVEKHFSGTAAAYVGKIASCHQYRWAVKNAPAIREEPYMTTTSDYENKIDIQLGGYIFSVGGAKKVLRDWKALNNELLENQSFGEKIEPDEVKELTSSIINGITSPEDKLKAIYAWITKSIVWTGEKSVFADNDIDDVIHYKKGNNAEITFLLLSMLKSAGINANPVIVSTRSNGKIQELYPIVSQFDYVIARVNIGINNYFVDATDPLRSFDILPQRVLNVKGLIIKPEKPEWVSLSTKKSNIDKTLINAKLKNDGTVQGNFTEQFGEYRSISLRKSLKDKTDSDLIKEIYDTESIGLNLESSLIQQKDSIALPLTIYSDMSSSTYSQLGGELIYFNPNFINRITDNPFKLADRKFPVDYSYSREKLVVINITIPKGYELKEKYPDKVMYVSNQLSYHRNMEVHEDIIQIISDFKIDDTIIKEKYYKQLKNFYAQLINAESELLVFGPKTNEPPIGK